MSETTRTLRAEQIAKSRDDESETLTDLEESSQNGHEEEASSQAPSTDPEHYRVRKSTAKTGPQWALFTSTQGSGGWKIMLKRDELSEIRDFLLQVGVADPSGIFVEGVGSLGLALGEPPAEISNAFSPELAFKVGDRVILNEESGQNEECLTGTIDGFVAEDLCCITFDDGSVGDWHTSHFTVIADVTLEMANSFVVGARVRLNGPDVSDPGTIEQVDNPSFLVRFDAGDRSWCHIDHLVLVDPFVVGARVRLREPIDEQSADGTIITELDDDSVVVRFDDGTEDGTEEIWFPVDLVLVEPTVDDVADILVEPADSEPSTPDNGQPTFDPIPSTIDTLLEAPDRWQATQRFEMKNCWSHYDDTADVEGQIAEEYLALEDLKTKKKAIDAEYNGKIKAKESKLSTLSKSISEGGEQVPTRCQWFYDYTNSRAQLRRVDNAAIVEDRRMTEDEVQMKLALDEDRHPDDQEGIADDSKPIPFDHPVFDKLCRTCGYHWVSDLAEIIMDGEPEHCKNCDSPDITVEPRHESLVEQIGEATNEPRIAITSPPPLWNGHCNQCGWEWTEPFQPTKCPSCESTVIVAGQEWPEIELSNEGENIPDEPWDFICQDCHHEWVEQWQESAIPGRNRLPDLCPKCESEEIYGQKRGATMPEIEESGSPHGFIGTEFDASIEDQPDESTPDVTTLHTGDRGTYRGNGSGEVTQIVSHRKDDDAWRTTVSFQPDKFPGRGRRKVIVADLELFLQGFTPEQPAMEGGSDGNEH